MATPQPAFLHAPPPPPAYAVFLCRDLFLREAVRMDACCLDTGEKSQSQQYILLKRAFPEESQRALHTAESVPGTEAPFPKCVGGVTPSPRSGKEGI